MISKIIDIYNKIDEIPRIGYIYFLIGNLLITISMIFYKLLCNMGLPSYLLLYMRASAIFLINYMNLKLNNATIYPKDD